MRKLLYTTVFVSGLTTMAVEMSASRLIGNYFGASNLVWASIIGLILIYLTVGYFVGGKLADRSPHFSTLFQLLAWGALCIGLIPIISRPILVASSQAFDKLDMAPLIGSFVAVFILFSIPVTLLGTASPFAIRLAIQDPKEAGSLAGRISAVSTAGSFIGTFLPVLVLTPAIGTYRTFLVCAGLLMLVALFGLYRTVDRKKLLFYAWMPVVLVIFAILGVRGFDKTADGLVYESESAYNYIQVLKSGDYRLLRLNEGQGVHSIYHPTLLNYGGPWEQVLVAPFFNQGPIQIGSIRSLAIVGLAAGTTARQAAAVYPNIQIDGYEIDPAIISVARQYFDLNLPNLNVVIQDGRWGLAHSGKQYQIISVDAYRPPYIPWHLTTQEFFQTVKNHLTEDGMLVINVGRGPSDRRMIDALYSTISSVFPSVYVVDLPNTLNSILFASAAPTRADNLLTNLVILQQDPATPALLLDVAQVTVANLKPSPLPSIVFTDDWAPVEQITNAMIMDFFLSGNLKDVQ